MQVYLINPAKNRVYDIKTGMDTVLDRATGCVFYCPECEEESPLKIEEALIESGLSFTGFRSSAKKPPSYHTKSGLHIYPADSWPSNNPYEVLDAVEYISSLGLGECFTLSKLARSIYEKFVLPKMNGVRINQDSIGICLSGIKQGICGVFQKDSEDSIMLDRKKSFLNPLSGMFPEQVIYLDDEDSLKEIEEALPDIQGIFSCIFNVPKQRIPPIISKVIAGTNRLGYGRVYSTVHSSIISTAMRFYGVTVEKVVRGCIFPENRQDRFYLEAYDFICSLENKLAKKCYQRLWGLLASTGSFRTSNEGKYTFTDSGCFWSLVEPLENGKIPVSFRPEHAAIITANNYNAQLGVIHVLGQENILGCHVDSVITKTTPKVKRVLDSGLWAEKANGQWRGYGIGNYTCGEHRACSGIKPGMLKSEYHSKIFPDMSRVFDDSGDSMPIELNLSDYKETRNIL